MRRRKKGQPFDLSIYDKVPHAQKLCMGYGAFGLISAMDSGLTDKEYLDACVRLSRELRKIFPDKADKKKQAGRKKAEAQCRAMVVNFHRGLFRRI